MSWYQLAVSYSDSPRGLTPTVAANSKYGHSSAVFKDSLNRTDQREGLWGSFLPIVSFYHTIQPNGTNGSKRVPQCVPPKKPCQHHTTRCCGPEHDTADPEPAGPVAADHGWIEWTAVPVADMDGNVEQDVFFRVTKIAPNGTVLDARYFATCKCSRSICRLLSKKFKERGCTDGFTSTMGAGLDSISDGAEIVGMGR